MEGHPKIGGPKGLGLTPGVDPTEETVLREDPPKTDGDRQTNDGALRKAYISSVRAHDVPPMNPQLRLHLPEGDRTVVAEAEYSKWAGTYDAETASYGWCAPQKLLEWTLETVPPASWLRVLDIGVGTGQAAAPYVEVGAQVTGLDISEKMLVEAKKNLPAFHHLGVYDINEPLSTAGVLPETYDLVTSCGTLHFAKDLAATIATAAEAIAPGGHFAFTYIPTQRRQFSSKTTPHPPSAVKQMLADAGLELVKSQSFTAYYDKGDPNDPVTYARVIARKPGAPEPLPEPLREHDRTTCVDRKRVRALFDAPLVTGPSGTKVVADNHAEITAMMAAFEAQLAKGEIDPALIPLPKTTPKVALEGAPNTDVLALLAHPDDETVYMGGSMAQLANAHRSVDVVHATGGNGGRGHESEDLLTVRDKEQRDALAAHGLDASRSTARGFDDFGKYRDNTTRSEPATSADTLDKWDASKLLEALVRRIREARPETIVSFEPTRDPNYSLHGHHLATGVATMLAFHLAADPQSFPEHLEEGLKPWAAQHHQVIVPNHTKSEDGTAVPIDREKKLAALVAHRSQRYSTDRLIRRLLRNDPSSRTEAWHRLQTRSPEAPGALGALGKVGTTS